MLDESGLSIDKLAKLIELASPEERAKLFEQAEAIARSLPWTPTPGPQMEAYYSPADILLYGGQAGGGKRLSDETLVPVPISTDESGWKKHGDLTIGDEVYTADGSITKVVHVTEPCLPEKAYEIEFSTGEVIVADADHLWLTFNEAERDALIRSNPEWRKRRRDNRPSRAVKNSKKPWVSKFITRINQERTFTYKVPSGSIRTTQEVADTLYTSGKRNAINHSIDVCSPIQAGHPGNLPIDPYLLGLWIGDGISSQASIGMLSDDWDDIGIHTDQPYLVSIDDKPPRKRAYEIRYFDQLKALKELGLKRNKRIPSIYLRASVEDRISLLQGICDTDGTVEKDKGAVSVGFSNSQLAMDLLELVSSLGIKTTLRSKIPTYQGGLGKEHWLVQFSTEIPCFRLKRKLALQKRDNFRPTVKRRYIVGARLIEDKVSMRCIKVAHPSGLYLVGKTFIVTHNTDLVLGLAFTQHYQTLVMRRKYTDLGGIIERAEQLNGGQRGFNKQPPPKLKRPDGRIIDFGAAQHKGDEQAWMGRPHDLICFDEATQFLESQVRLLLGWLRTTKKGQRTRAIMATNPPLDANGDWIIGFFRPWLDLTHPNPARHGELRWYVTAPDGSDLEVEGPNPVQLPGMREPMLPMSRTFIPSKLSDNPFLANTGYQAKLDGLPEPLRSAVRDGNFMASRGDADYQVIPTQWIVEAQARWKEDGWRAYSMTSCAIDIGAGRDETVLARLHGTWVAEPIVVKGEKARDPKHAASMIFEHRKDNCSVIVDVGGGYGGATIAILRENGIPYTAFNASHASTATSQRAGMKFVNKRAEAWWKFREALDPNQEGGSLIALPPDATLKADLAAPTWSGATTRGIQIESKDDIRKRLGRSTDRGDAVVMAFLQGGMMSTARGVVQKSARGNRPNVLHNRRGVN